MEGFVSARLAIADSGHGTIARWR